MGQGPSDVALKIASRTTGTKEKPIEIRLRELGTDRVRVSHVWTELTPFSKTANPFWRGNPSRRKIDFEVTKFNWRIFQEHLGVLEEES